MANPDSPPNPAPSDDPERFRLVGDENCGVALHCLDCDRGGLPLAYLDGGLGGYDHQDVEATDTILGLLTHADAHGWRVHGRRPRFNPYSRSRFDRAYNGSWIVPRTPHTDMPVGPRVRDEGMIRREAGDSSPTHARQYAAQLLAAADEAEHRRGRSSAARSWP
ncbi:hypothetical protein [Actinomadura violacea]|uniref:Uncharacterized protein n=1 Tax=Actinomadura violacea TaxID=2819934 RepID=A0ABS3RYT4_9ACTN|nr:hypothetical protein [Actinomadura violacea]MBO2461170.1 hypothetical protein [Actinomadura violacea]